MKKRVCEICGEEVKERRRTIYITVSNPHLVGNKCYKEWTDYWENKKDD